MPFARSRLRPPQQALAIARTILHDRNADLDFAPCDITGGVDEIVACDADKDELASWYSDQVRLRLAAPRLLLALEQALKALNTAPRFAVPCLDSDSYRIVALCTDAIAAASGDK